MNVQLNLSVKSAAPSLALPVAIKSQQATSAVAEKFFSSPEPDYETFKSQLLRFVEPNGSAMQHFCRHLDESGLCKSERLLLLRALSRLAHQPLEPGQLAQLLKQATRLREQSGVRLFWVLFSAPVSPQKCCVDDYLILCQLLLQLRGEPDLCSLLRKYLPDLSKAIGLLRGREESLFSKRYPMRDIEEAIRRFKETNEIVKFPLSETELSTLETEYRQVAVALAEVKKSALSNPAEAAKTCQSKYQLIAILAEVLRRVQKVSPYDTQLITLLALLNFPQKMKGRIAQMKPSEGKSTMIALLSAYMGCRGRFICVFTTSSYLADRDSKKYAAYYQTLGLTVSSVCAPEPRPEHFQAQILYGTNTDFEFAYLRDGLNNAKLLSHPFDVAIVDEADNLFLDAACNSALLSIPGHEDWSWIYGPILDFVKQKGEPASLRSWLLTRLADRQEEIGAFSDKWLRTRLVSACIALRQKQEKRDYIVKWQRKPGEVQESREITILDYQNTGRLNEGSQWKDGIHQFLQVKHGLPATPEGLTAASIAHPTFFGLFSCILGLTGTIGEEVERKEIQEIYGIDSFDVPPHLPSQRKKLPFSLFATREEQYAALLCETEALQRVGRPSLLLFSSVEKSNAFSETLLAKGISHQLLNETQREEEEFLIARAGDPGVITVATNTAGRGTDILLALQSKTNEGLEVIFAFFPENLRVEEQGFGRAGRHGDPGSCRMILNSEDEEIQELLKGLNILGTTDEIFSFLGHLRTKKIEQLSKMRFLSAEKERFCFEKMQNFFQGMQNLHQLFEQKEFKEAWIQACKTHAKKSSHSAPDLPESWNSLRKSFQSLAELEKAGLAADWDSLFERFCSTYLASLKRPWAMFYSKLHDTLEECETENAKRTKVEELYEASKLQRAFSQPREQTLAVLRGLF